jgi:GNAT superfamily N-acetyltransferase
MKIQKYEIWMRVQIIELFKLEYGHTAADFDLYFDQFYEHPFQSDNGIRIVALDDKKVIGFQSFFNWPIQHKGQLVRSYQSGNSLVHPDYRGKGLFSKMLQYLDTAEAQIPYDLLIGFPVEMSFGAFIKKKWLNPFDLQWYIKPLHPVRALLTNPESKMTRSWGARIESSLANSSETVQVEQSKGYDQYRIAHQKGDYWRFHFSTSSGTVLFELKSQVRKKILKELIIGRIVRSSPSPELLQQAIEALVEKINATASFSFLSIAINPLSPVLVDALNKASFRKINKKIHFVTTGSIADSESDWASWELYRGDIDTW